MQKNPNLFLPETKQFIETHSMKTSSAHWLAAAASEETTSLLNKETGSVHICVLPDKLQKTAPPGP